MKKLILLLLSFCLFTIPVSVMAGAAEKWEYDIEPIPDPSQRKVLVTGHKVDQYGDAVNDSKYKTTIDPKTIANKQKMGAVGMAKLLKKANWASIGVEALQQLLQAVDWVIDPAAQSIWRNKRPTESDPIYGCKNYGFNWKNVNSYVGTCPIDVARNRLQTSCRSYMTNCTIVGLFADSTFKQDLGTMPATFIPTQIYVKWTGDTNGVPSTYTEILTKGDKITDQNKEYLTPEALADYANKTHSDYSNPELAPKLDPKYKPEIIPNLWKPHNEWEKTNSPTVQEVNKQLDQANPSSDSTDVDPKTDAEGNPNGFSLPAFCSWATPVCDFFKWFKTDDVQEQEDDQVEEDKDIPTINTNLIQASGQCPPDLKLDIPAPFGESNEISFSYATFCLWLSNLKPWVLLTAHIIGIAIIGGRGADNG